jgi:alpha-aminoadipate carrier protein LysW
MATCPECDAEIDIDDDDLAELQVGDSWDCDDCGSLLRVASLVPLEFDSDEDDEDDDAAEEKDDEEADDLDDELEEDDEDDDGADWDE